MTKLVNLILIILIDPGLIGLAISLNFVFDKLTFGNSEFVKHKI
jgi:hypothetical protein